MYQVGLCFQAGFVTLWVNASVEIGTCDIAMNSASSRGMSAAKSATKFAWSIHQSPLLSALNASGGLRHGLFDRRTAFAFIERKGGNVNQCRNICIVAGLGDDGPTVS